MTEGCARGSRAAPIGLALTLIHLISIPVTNTSVNPARSLAPALFVGDWALAQLWVFLIFPTIGGIVGGLAYRYLLEVRADERDKMEGPGEARSTRRPDARAVEVGLRPHFAADYEKGPAALSAAGAPFGARLPGRVTGVSTAICTTT